MAFAYPPAVVQESVIPAAAPSKRQQTVTFLSFGETSLAAGTKQLITQVSDATASGVAAQSYILGGITSFYAQGSGSSCYIYEFGTVTGTHTAAIQAYLTANPAVDYVLVLDPETPTETAFPELASTYSANTACLYFIATVAEADIAALGTSKSIIAVTQATSVSATSTTEYDAGALAYTFASLAPTSSAPVPNWQYQFFSGVTQYCAASATGTINTLGATGTNFFVPATVGGMTDIMLLGGCTMDGNPISYWYGTDFAYLQLTQALNALVISRAQNKANPLDFNQSGINDLLATGTSSLSASVACRAIVNPFTITATDFIDWIKANPTSYSAGAYGGLSATVVPKRGFQQVTFQLTIDFTGQSLVTAANAASA